MQQNQDSNKNPSNDKAKDAEKAQAQSQSKVREGQENSSILHDEKDDENELHRDVTKPDISSTSQEEFIEDRNTKKGDGA